MRQWWNTFMVSRELDRELRKHQPDGLVRKVVNAVLPWLLAGFVVALILLYLNAVEAD